MATKSDYDTWYSDYDTWYSDADGLVTLIDGFYKWVPFFDVPDGLETLKELMKNVVLPREPDSDHDYFNGETGGEYWTIERMFEDL